MKNKYIKKIIAAALSCTLIFAGCTTGTTGGSSSDDSKNASVSEEESSTAKSSSSEKSKESSSEEKSSEEEGSVSETSKGGDSTTVEATTEAVVEDGWTADTVYGLSYAVPPGYNMIIDDISDHSERGSYYEKAYDIGEGDGCPIGIHIYAYKKNSGVSSETSYTDAKSRTEDHTDLSFEEVSITNLAAKVYRASETEENSYLPYTYVYIFEKSADDPYIYEVFFNDRFEESALRLAFEKTLSF